MSDVTFGALLGRGAVAGAIAGLLAAVVGWTVTDGVIDRALAVEHARGATDGAAHSHDDPLVGRDWQVFGGGLAALLAGLCFGVIFSVVLAKFRHRLPGRTDFARAMTLALMAFGAVAFFPAVLYPSNPPAVGDPETIDERTVDYLLVVVVGISIAVLAVMTYVELERRRLDLPIRATGTVLATVGMFTIAFLALPKNPDEIASDVPPDLLWDFRLASLAELATLWIGLGLATGLLLGYGKAARRRRLAEAMG